MKDKPPFINNIRQQALYLFFRLFVMMLCIYKNNPSTGFEIISTNAYSLVYDSDKYNP